MSKQQRFIRLPEVSARVGFAKSKIYSLVKEGEFPSPIKLSRRSSAWLESAIDQWIAARIEASRLDRERSLTLDREIVRREAHR